MIRAAIASCIVVVAAGCFDLDSFVMNPKHCSVGYTEDDCAQKKLCAACGEDFDFTQWGIPQENATRTPIVLDDGNTNDAWFVKAAAGGPLEHHTIVFAHGNFGGLEHYINRVGRLWEMGVNVLALDYRGFGHSSDANEASEAQFMADARAVSAQVPSILEAQGLDGSRPVSLYGYSAGSLVTVEMAVTTTPCLLILEAGFPSVEIFARDSTFIGVPGTFVTTGEWNNAKKLERYTAPYVHLHGAEDDFVREATGRELFSHAASADKVFISVPGAAHGNFIPGVSDTLRPDVAEVLGGAYTQTVSQIVSQRCL